jgi:hypothetical protein
VGDINMTPKEKASELVWGFYNDLEHTLSDDYTYHDWDIAQNCAIKVVDEIFQFMKDDDELNDDCHFANHKKWVTYWTEVRNELKTYNSTHVKLTIQERASLYVEKTNSNIDDLIKEPRTTEEWLEIFDNNRIPYSKPKTNE